MRHFARIVRIAAACIALLLAQSAAAQSLQGVYVNATQPADTIDQAIDAAVAKMNFIKRPIARGRLARTNPLYGRIEISQDAAEIRVRFDDGNPVVMPLDGASTQWTRGDGEVFDVSANLQESQLIQTFKAGDGQRVNHFSLEPDGSTLTLQVTLSSPQLPEPVKYTLTYRRSS